MPRRKRKQDVPEFDHVEPVWGNLQSYDPDTLLRTHRKLRRAVRNILNSASSGAVLLDLSNCEEIDTGGLLLTMYAFTQIWNREDLSLWYRSHGAVRATILENLAHYWEERSRRAADPSEDFLLRQIESRAVMVRDLNQYADSLRRASYSSDEDVAIWETQVGELTTNGFQHGTALSDDPDNTAPVMNMVAGKTYEEDPRVEMGVLDFGAGIPRVIEQVAPEISEKGDGMLIAHALKRGVTSRTVPENQGAGLYGIVKAVKDNDGRLLILSGNGLACVNNRRISSRKLSASGESPTLDGTLAIIILRLQRGG